MPGAIQIFAKSIGKSEAEMFKLMEQGQLLAEDVLPKVAVEMRKIASVGLEKKLHTLRVAQGQFRKELEMTQKLIFDSGFSEGLRDLFFTFTDGLRDNEEALKSLGAVYKFIFDIVNGASQVVIPIFSELVNMLGSIASGLDTVFGDNSAKVVASWVATVMVALSPLTRVLTIIASIFSFMNSFFEKDKINFIEKMVGLDFNFDLKGLYETVNPFAQSTGAKLLTTQDLVQQNGKTYIDRGTSNQNNFYIQSNDAEEVARFVQEKIFSENSNAMIVGN